MLTATANTPPALVFAGQHALTTGDLRAARHYFEQGTPGAIFLLKTSGTIGLAWVLQRSGQTEQARQHTREAARQLERTWGSSPKRPEDYADLARVRVLQGDREGARCKPSRRAFGRAGASTTKTRTTPC